MSCEDHSIQTLRDSGRRLTPQRVLILSSLRHADGHMTASEILDRVRESYPYIDSSTVYRTLSVLKKLRLISETDVGAGEMIYEWLRQDRHHHLICRDCGNLTKLDHAYMASLGAEILDDYGFEADVDHIAVFGRCANCAPTIVGAADDISKEQGSDGRWPRSKVELNR